MWCVEWNGECVGHRIEVKGVCLRGCDQRAREWRRDLVAKKVETSAILPLGELSTDLICWHPRSTAVPLLVGVDTRLSRKDARYLSNAMKEDD